MYQRILLCAAICCCQIFPVTAAEDVAEDGIVTSQDLQTVAIEANSWQGTRYRYGGRDKNGVDCSHFVHAVYSQVFEGFDYRMANEYLSDAEFSPTKSPLVGDVIIFPSVRGSSAHMGIITNVRAKKFIGAQSSTGVKEASFAPGSYWGKRPYQILSLLSADDSALGLQR